MEVDRFYNIHDLLKFRAFYERNFIEFKNDLKQFKSPVNQPSIDLIFPSSQKDIPSSGTTVTSGVYKMIPWTLALRKDDKAHETIYFYSPIFTTFLAWRMVIIPLLKREIVQRNGFSLIGSAFQYQNEIFIVSGYPGSGKTSILMQALERDAMFMCDNELLFKTGSPIIAISNEIELRWNTVRNTRFLKRLSPADRVSILMNHLLSIATAQHINFNVVVNPASIGIAKDQQQNPAKIHFILLKPNTPETPVERSVFVEEFLAYESRYASLFGESLYSKEMQIQASRHFEIFLNECNPWIFPLGTSFDKILSTTQQTK